MFKDLKASKVSSIMTMAGCPKETQNQCGIVYRSY